MHMKSKYVYQTEQQHKIYKIFRYETTDKCQTNEYLIMRNYVDFSVQ